MTYEQTAKTKFEALRTQENMTILAIESSCDETACAITRGRQVLSNVISSQISIHEQYGGVVPEIASRQHTQNVVWVVNAALSEAKLTHADIDAIAVTYGAGLLGALLVGVAYAKALAYSWEIPLIAVSHIQGHIAAGYIANADLQPPYIALVVSGGHTALVDVRDYTDFHILGSTQDDACGEAFDKVARVLGLLYPGGPNVERLASQGNPTIPMPRPFHGAEHLNFSYSGLKTAVINTVHHMEQTGEEIPAADIACSFQTTAVDMLVDNAITALRRTGYDTVSVAGGVGANGYLRKKLVDVCAVSGYHAYLPPRGLCTDNAAMIGCQAYYLIRAGVGLAGMELDAVASLALDKIYTRASV